MATELLVDERIDEGQELLARLLREGLNVAVAFWVRTADSGHWRFYIGLSSVAPEKIGEASGRLYVCLTRTPRLSLDSLEIRPVLATDPIALDAIEVRDRRPGTDPIHYQGKRLGELAIQEAYIYPVLPQPGRPSAGEERRLTTEVAQVDRPEDYSLTQTEKAAVAQLMAQGINLKQAEEWVRKRREKLHPRPPIPAGTVVRTWPAASWGPEPEDDPNPLLLVEAEDGARGLTFKDDTEPLD